MSDLIKAFALLFSVCSVFLTTPAFSEPTPTLKVLTQNIWGLPAILVKNKRIRIKKFCSMLKEKAQSNQQWDIVLIQELWMKKDHLRLKNCGYTYVSSLDDKSLESGLIVLSKYPLLADFKLEFKNRYDRTHIDAERFAHKSAQFVLIDHPNFGPIWVANTHLAAPNKRFTNDSLRSAQLKEIRDQIIEFNPDLPTLFGGDLNTSKKVSDQSWKMFESLFKDFSEATVFCEGQTDNRQMPPEMIDHILTNQQLKSRCGNTILDKKFRIRKRKWITYSDHTGWETTFVDAE